MAWFANRQDILVGSGVILAESATRGIACFEVSNSLLYAIPFGLSVFLHEDERHRIRFIALILLASSFFVLEKHLPEITDEYNACLVDRAVNEWFDFTRDQLPNVRAKVAGADESSRRAAMKFVRVLETQPSIAFDDSLAQTEEKLGIIQTAVFELVDQDMFPATSPFPRAPRKVKHLGIPQAVVHMLRHSTWNATWRFLGSLFIEWCLIGLSHLFSHSRLGSWWSCKETIPPFQAPAVVVPSVPLPPEPVADETVVPTSPDTVQSASPRTSSSMPPSEMPADGAGMREGQDAAGVSTPIPMDASVARSDRPAGTVAAPVLRPIRRNPSPSGARQKGRIGARAVAAGAESCKFQSR